jgi:hypothetical protein
VNDDGTDWDFAFIKCLTSHLERFVHPASVWLKRVVKKIIHFTRRRFQSVSATVFPVTPPILLPQILINHRRANDIPILIPSCDADKPPSADHHATRTNPARGGRRRDATPSTPKNYTYGCSSYGLTRFMVISPQKR